MPTATINMLYCVHEATGTDVGVLEALVGALPTEFFSDALGVPVFDAIQALPEVIGAIDVARSDPDSLYVTTLTEGALENAIWPSAADETVDMQAGQSVAPMVSVDFALSQNISLWDHDTVSADDLLGSVTILASEQGRGEIAKLAKSAVESSYYYVFYVVE